MGLLLGRPGRRRVRPVCSPDLKRQRKLQILHHHRHCLQRNILLSSSPEKGENYNVLSLHPSPSNTDHCLQQNGRQQAEKGKKKGIEEKRVKRGETKRRKTPETHLLLLGAKRRARGRARSETTALCSHSNTLEQQSNTHGHTHRVRQTLHRSLDQKGEQDVERESGRKDRKSVQCVPVVSVDLLPVNRKRVFGGLLCERVS